MKTESDMKDGHSSVAPSSSEGQQLSEQLDNITIQKEDMLKRAALLESEIVNKEKELKKAKWWKLD